VELQSSTPVSVLSPEHAHSQIRFQFGVALVASRATGLETRLVACQSKLYLGSYFASFLSKLLKEIMHIYIQLCDSFYFSLILICNVYAVLGNYIEVTGRN
jgi:hypothetical protein